MRVLLFRSALSLALLSVLCSCARSQAVQRSAGPPYPSEALHACAVSRIADGDTFECDSGERIRFIGIDTPELSQRPFGRTAAEALESLIPVGSIVYIELGLEARDRYDRVLAHVWSDSTLVNWRLVREGWAVTLTYPPNVKYVDWLTRAQTAAREDEAGLWAVGGFECAPLDRRRGACD